MNPSCPLEVRGLSKRYGTLDALQNVSFSLEPGEVFALLGPNGAGKTSLISILTTLEKPTAGEAFIFGRPVGPATKALLGSVPQEIVSHGFFTVAEVLRFHSGYYGLRHNEKHIESLIERLGLGPHRDKLVRKLSGGMKRRLLIAKALVHHPKLLLLDEPSAGVDVELRTSMWEFIRDLREQGTAVLLTTHYLEEAEELCSRVAVLHHGKLLRLERTDVLVRTLTSREIHFALRTPVVRPDHPLLVEATPTCLKFRAPNGVKVGDLLRETKIPYEALEDVKVHEGTLEEAFLSLTEAP